LIASLHTFGATTKINRENLYALWLQFLFLFFGENFLHMTIGNHLCSIYMSNIYMCVCVWPQILGQFFLDFSWNEQGAINVSPNIQYCVYTTLKNPSLKEKNWTVHKCMLSLPIGCMKILFPKLLVTIFHSGDMVNKASQTCWPCQ
jgi:hypothetical protein